MVQSRWSRAKISRGNINVFISFVDKSCHQPWNQSLGRVGKMWVYLQLASIIVITSLSRQPIIKISLVEMNVVARCDVVLAITSSCIYY